MQRRQFGLAIGVATMLVAIGGPAVATSAAAMKPSKVSPPTVIAKTSEIATPQVLVDSKGTVNIIWTGIHGQDTYGDPIPTVMYARKPAGAKAFTRVTLPHVVGDDSYLLFQPSPGVLELLVQAGSNAISAIRSTNDGVSWSTMNAAALNNPNLDNQSIYLEVGSMVAAPQGPIEFTGANAHGATEIIQINPALTTLTPVAADQLSITGPSIGRTPGGATFEVARYTPSTVPFQVGSHTGQLTFPTCTDATDPSLAVGHSVAVVAETGCGHVWATTISTTGKVGHRETLGVSASQSSGLAGTPWVEAVADRSGHFTVVERNQVDDRLAVGANRSALCGSRRALDGSGDVVGDGCHSRLGDSVGRHLPDTVVAISTRHSPSAPRTHRFAGGCHAGQGRAEALPQDRSRHGSPCLSAG
jgi:hypothetical protein